jgi:hypothetical protein
MVGRRHSQNHLNLKTGKSRASSNLLAFWILADIASTHCVCLYIKMRHKYFIKVNFIENHVKHLEPLGDSILNRLLGMVVDVENIFMSMNKELDSDTKRVYFYLFKVSLLFQKF